MAKLSRINRNNKVAAIGKRYAAKRNKLKAITANKALSLDERFAATQKLADMPRNSSATRYRNRCELTGRPNGVYRKFKLSRNMLRQLANDGMLPGVTKASW